jgi:UDP:flavonoid glycosyltransferase YjiC (YdhE family)
VGTLTIFVSNSLVSEFAPNRPYKSIKEITEETLMTFITIEITCFDFPKVSTPNYRFIGSLGGAIKAEPLPNDFKAFADGAMDGLIVVTFGSMIRLRQSIRSHIHMLISALGRMKERAIVQFTASELEGTEVPSNVLIREWLPQFDLLSHPNTRLFIAHGGMNGHLEATYIGIPILTMPLQREQERNGARAQAKGHGKLLKWEETNTEEIYMTIRELIDNEKYKESISKCSAILKEVPSAREQLAFWVNHILKHGAAHLRPLAADMPWYQFFGFDVMAVFAVSILLFNSLLFFCCRFCCRKCWGSGEKVKTD